MKLGQRARLQLPEFLLIDQMIADQPVLRTVAKLDVERERLEQLITLERGTKIGAGAVALVELVQARNDRFQIRCRLPVIVKGPHAFLAFTGDTRMAEVDM